MRASFKYALLAFADVHSPFMDYGAHRNTGSHSQEHGHGLHQLKASDYQPNCLQVLHKYLQFNACAIDFWLEHCTYRYEAKFFPENLRKTAWHMAETQSGKVRLPIS